MGKSVLTCLVHVATVIILIGSFSCVSLADDTIRIASIFSFSGDAAKANEDSVLGVRLGVQEVNELGGLLGMKLELIEIDNMSTPIGSKVAADKAVKENVVAVIGPAWSSHSIAVAPIAQANRIPMITNISTNEKVTRIGDCIFRVCYTDSFQGRVMASFAREDLKVHTAVIFVDITSDYSMGLAKEFQYDFEKMGGRVLEILQYKYKQDDFMPMVLQAKKSNPDILFIPGHDESGIIVKHAVNSGLEAIPLGGDGWAVEAFYRKGGDRMKKGYYSTHWDEEVQSDVSKRFVSKYKGSRKLNPAEALGYDAVMLLADAIVRSGSINRERIRSALAGTTNYQGVTGTITFDSAGNPIKGAVIMTIGYGEARFLKSIPADEQH
ncbi:MAG: ABC transporter substrate-binding protein [Deltaproteobacteria bacterium]|nr:ABC transporter substrate-binding protein [Deltaproteobacteria bacterium]